MSRVPDADGPWIWGTSADDWGVLHLTDRDLGPALPSRVDERWVSPWEYEEECRDIRHPGRWLGPVAPPVGEGEVMVRMPKDLAVFGAKFIGECHQKLRPIRDPVGSTISEGRESMRRLIVILRAALGES